MRFIARPRVKTGNKWFPYYEPTLCDMPEFIKVPDPGIQLNLFHVSVNQFQ